jgi:hypothetical protein
MRVVVTAMKNFPSKRASRLVRARSSAPRSSPRIESIDVPILRGVHAINQHCSDLARDGARR